MLKQLRHLRQTEKTRNNFIYSLAKICNLKRKAGKMCLEIHKKTLVFKMRAKIEIHKNCKPQR